MCSHHIGLFSLLIASVTLVLAVDETYFNVTCNLGDPRNLSKTEVEVNGSLTSQFNNARHCHVKHELESAIVRVTITGLDASSNLSALCSIVLENYTILFVGMAHSYDLANNNKYHFHACPQGHAQGTVNDLDFLFFGAPENESISVKIELDNSALIPANDEVVSLRSNGLAEVKALDIDDEQLSHLLQITVSSEDDEMECRLVVSQSCSSAQSQGLVEKSSEVNQPSIKLTFTKSGRITLSQYSRPKIATGRWYIGISCKSIDKKTFLQKNVTVNVKKGYEYDMRGKMLPTAYMCIFAIVGGIFIAAFAHFFLNPDFDESSFPFHLEEAQGKNRVPSKGILDYVPEPIPRWRFPIKQWFKIIVAWFRKGTKTYSYLTAVLAISFMVGAAQFVIARWSNMIEEGDRDLCYYNELCYRPIAIADVPSNFMLSNVPYVIHGLFLALSFSFREAIKQEAGHSRYSLENARRKRFAPYNYSVAYALAWALIFEGLFSATYHLCPSRLTFQFDSAFMFIISGLVVVALYNCRVKSIYLSGSTEDSSKKHPSETTVQAPKYFLFFVAPLLVLNYLGSVKDTSENFPPFFVVLYWVALTSWLIFMYAWTFQKMGIPCQWRNWKCGPDEECCETKALIKWVWIILFPFCLLVIGLQQKDDWSQFFLFSCVAAVVLTILGLMSFDTAVTFKRYQQSGGNCCSGIRQLFQPRKIFLALLRNWHRVLYVIVTFLFWVFAMYFFKMKPTTRKADKPSTSRTQNKECVLLDFFDYHDIWHMLSSFALFMSAYLLIYVTRKVEIYFWVEAQYWNNKNRGNKDIGSTEELMEPIDVDLVFKGKQKDCGIVMEKSMLDNSTVRFASNTEYANVSYV